MLSHVGGMKRAFTITSLTPLGEGASRQEPVFWAKFPSWLELELMPVFSHP